MVVFRNHSALFSTFNIRSFEKDEMEDKGETTHVALVKRKREWCAVSCPNEKRTLERRPRNFEKMLFRSVDLFSKFYSVQYCSFRKCVSFIVLFHVGGTIYKRQHREKYLYRRTVFRHVRNFGESPMASYFKYEMGYVAFARQSRNKRIRGCALVYVCVWNLSERWKIFAAWNVTGWTYTGRCTMHLLTVIYIIRRYTHTHTHTPRAVAYYFGMYI